MSERIPPASKVLKVDASKVQRLAQTEQEKQLIANLEKITNALKELYKDRQNVKLVQDVLSSRTRGDKAVYLRDLLNN